MRRSPALVAPLVLGIAGLGAGSALATRSPGGVSEAAATPGIGLSTTTAAHAPTSGGPTSTVGLSPQSTTSPGPTTSTTGTTSTTVPPAGDGVYLTGHVPAAAQAQIDAVRRTPPRSTVALLDALAPLGALGYSQTQAAILGFGRFPVAGPARWADDWLEPRFAADGTFSFHEGNDIPAACGTPIRAPSDGTVRPGADEFGGNNVVVTESDGTYIYMAHLAGYPPGEGAGNPVRVGDVIGYVGRTGAATGCHVHLEIHPRGGAAVDPKAFLDAWASEALADAPVIVDAVRADHGLGPAASG